jgi:hypothetical protein
MPGLPVAGCNLLLLLFKENLDAFAACYSTFVLIQKWSKKSSLHKKA